MPTDENGDVKLFGFSAKTNFSLRPKIIVTLGGAALEALKTIEYHQYTLRAEAGKILRREERISVPPHHLSPRANAAHASRLQTAKCRAKRL